MSINKPQISINWLIPIILLGGILRLYHLSSNPPSIYWEETALGYDAYSILKTGKDFHGNSWPLLAFESFGDYKPPLYFYTIIPFIFIFNLSATAVRMPSFVCGVLTIFLVYSLARNLKLSLKASLFSALLIAISPWHIQFSRTGFEVNLASTLFLTGILFAIKSTKNSRLFFVSAFFLGISAYAYHSFRLIAPLAGIWLAISQYKIPTKTKIISLLIGLIILTPILLLIKNPIINQRFQETNIISQSHGLEIITGLQQAHGNNLWSKLIYHRYWFWSKQILEQFFSYLDPKFLFVAGDDNLRHTNGIMGILYLIEIITIPLGLRLIFVQKKYAQVKSILPLIIFILIPASISMPSPHVLRSMPILPYLVIISTIGLIYLYKNYRKFFLILLCILVTQFGLWMHHFYIHYPLIVEFNWQYGYEATYKFLESIKKPNQKIYFTREFGRPSIYFMFYTQYPPQLAQAINSTTPKDQGEYLAVEQYLFTDKFDQAQSGDIIVSSKKESFGNALFTQNIYNSNLGFYVYQK